MLRLLLSCLLCCAILPTGRPAPAAAEPVPCDVVWPVDARGPCPVAVVGHAYLTDPRHYRWLAELLAGAGFVAAVPSTHLTWPADADLFAADLVQVLADLRAQGADPASPLHGLVGDRAVAVGHSLGGAAAVRAAAQGAFDALVTLAVLDGGAAPTRRYAPQVTVPTLMLAVATDCVTPPAGHEWPVWENLAAVERTGIMLRQGTHCGFAGADPDCTDAEAACGTAAADGSRQRARTGELLLLWLRAALDGDETARRELQAGLEGAADLDWRGGAPVPAAPAAWGGLRGAYR